MDDDLYELLEVSPRASGEVIQAAYRRLARTYHPDGEAPDPEKMVRLNRAFGVLGDPAKRSAYDRGRGAAVVPDVAPSRPPWRTAFPLPPLDDLEEAAPKRSRTAPGVLGVLGVIALVVVFSGVVFGASLRTRGDSGRVASEATAEARATAAPIELPVPAGAPLAATPAPAETAPPVDLGPIASEIPGTPLSLGSSVRSVVDQNTKPRDVYAVTLVAGQEVRFVLTELTAPISAWVDTSVVNPGARDLSDTRLYTLALTRTTYVRDEWRFTPAVAGTYYLVVRARTSAQAYAFTLAATR